MKVRDRTAGLTMDRRGVVVSGFAVVVLFTSPQTAILVTEKGKFKREDIG